MPKLVPVEGNPFEPKLTPVEGNPFAVSGTVENLQSSEQQQAERYGGRVNPASPSPLSEIFAGIPEEKQRQILEEYQARESQNNSQMSQSEFHKIGMNSSNRKTAQQAADLERIRVENPALAELIENTGGIKGAAIGYQSGLRDIGEGTIGNDAFRMIGPAARLMNQGYNSVVDRRDDATKSHISKLADQNTGTVIGQAAGQSAPFVIPAIGASKIPALGPRLAAMSGIGGLESGAIAAADGGTTGEIALSASLGSVLAPLGDLAPVIVRRMGRKALTKPDAVGADDVNLIIDDSGKITPEFEKFVDENGIDFTKDVAEEAAKIDGRVSGQQAALPTDDAGGIATQTARVATDSKNRGMQELIQNASPDPARVSAASELGLEGVPAPVLSSNQAFQEIGGGLSAIPGNKASTQLDNFAKQMGMKADDIIKEFGGDTDKVFYNQELLRKMSDTRETLYKAEGKAYEKLRDSIGGSRMVSPQSMVDQIVENAKKELGGIKYLDGVEKKLLKRLSGGAKDLSSVKEIPYGVIDRERQLIGADIGRHQGVYKNGTDRQLNRLYSQLTDLQESVASNLGVGDSLRAAKDQTIARKSLEESTKELFGSDLTKSYVPRLSSAINDITGKKFGEFGKIVKSIPKEDRAAAVMTAMNGVFTGSNSPNRQFTASFYSKWFKNLRNSPRAYQAFSENLPEGGMKRLEAMAKISDGLQAVTKNRVRTGVTMTMLNEFDKSNGIAAKIYGLSENPVVDLIPGAGGSVRLTSRIAEMASKRKTPAIQAADNLITSEVFQKAFIKTALNPDSMSATASQNALKRSSVYNMFVDKQDANTAASIASMGLIPWILSDNESQDNN